MKKNIFTLLACFALLCCMLTSCTKAVNAPKQPASTNVSAAKTAGTTSTGTNANTPAPPSSTHTCGGSQGSGG